MIYVYIVLGGYVAAILTLISLVLVVNTIERRQLERKNDKAARWL